MSIQLPNKLSVMINKRSMTYFKEAASLNRLQILCTQCLSLLLQHLSAMKLYIPITSHLTCKVNGVECEVWSTDFGMVVLYWSVTNITDKDGKMIWVMVQFLMDVSGENTTMDFTNVIPQPQANSLFDPKKYGCSPPPPRTTNT